MTFNIGDTFHTRFGGTRYVLVGFRANGKVVARNPNWGRGDSDFGMEAMPEHLEAYLKGGSLFDYQAKNTLCGTQAENV